MSDRVTFLAQIPQAMQILAAADDQPLGRSEVQGLLAVRRSRAARIMQVAGGYLGGKSLRIKPADLLAYLETKADPKALHAERERQLRFARKLDAMRREFLEKPPCLGETAIPEEDLCQFRLDSLPEGVRLEVGRLTVDFQESRDLKEKLYTLAIAMGFDQKNGGNQLAQYEQSIHFEVA